MVSSWLILSCRYVEVPSVWRFNFLSYGFSYYMAPTVWRFILLSWNSHLLAGRIYLLPEVYDKVHFVAPSVWRFTPLLCGFWYHMVSTVWWFGFNEWPFSSVFSCILYIFLFLSFSCSFSKFLPYVGSGWRFNHSFSLRVFLQVLLITSAGSFWRFFYTLYLYLW